MQWRGFSGVTNDAEWVGATPIGRNERWKSLGTEFGRQLVKAGGVAMPLESYAAAR